MNRIVLVGKLIAEPVVKNNEKGSSIVILTLEVKRNYKNKNGEFVKDILKCYLHNIIAEKTLEYCHIGDIIGISGIVQGEINNEEIKMEIIAEKVTFLTSNKSEDKNDKY